MYKYGIYNENLFNTLLKQELKDDVEQTVIDNILKSKDKTPINDIKEFLEKIIYHLILIMNII
jgi:CO dehydrogenase/acetyl-CoA synthase beta subunit